jgi:hypothetical protein
VEFGKVRTKTREPNYLRKIIAAYQEHPELFKSGTITQLHVYHDTWCSFWKGKPCNCDPEIVQEVKR